MRIVKSLKQAGANVNAQEKNGKMSFMYAAGYTTILVIHFVLLETGVGKLIQDQTGRRAYNYFQNSPIMIRANKNFPIAYQLLEIFAEFE